MMYKILDLSTRSQYCKPLSVYSTLKGKLNWYQACDSFSNNQTNGQQIFLTNNSVSVVPKKGKAMPKGMPAVEPSSTPIITVSFSFIPNGKKNDGTCLKLWI